MRLHEEAMAQTQKFKDALKKRSLTTNPSEPNW
jgi:hypothetical protein